MTYTTNLGNGMGVRSKDLRLTRGKIVRQHTVVEGALIGTHIIEDRSTRKCEVYMNSVKVANTNSLTAAYTFLTEKAA